MPGVRMCRNVYYAMDALLFANSLLMPAFRLSCPLLCGIGGIPWLACLVDSLLVWGFLSLLMLRTLALFLV